MNTLTALFGEPLALCLLAAVPVAVLLARHEARRRHAAQVALGGPAGGRHREVVRRAGAVLLVGAIALAALASARPRWGLQEAPLEQRGVDVVIVLDISRSMLAQDVVPSRAQASAAAVGELLTHLQGNRVGLVTFAGSSFPRSPLTLDIEAVRTLVQRAQGESSLVRPGSDLGGAVEAALTLLDVEDRATTQVVLVVTDGEVQQADITAVGAAAGKARGQQVRVFGAFAATETPIALPASSGGTDITRGQRTPLVALAEQTDARVRDVAQVPGLAVEFRRLQQTRFAETSRQGSVERFQWFAGAALAFIVLPLLLPRPSSRRPSRRWRGFRRSPRALRSGVLGMLLLTLMLLSGCTALLGTPVYRAVAEGNRLYAEERYEEALAAYDRASAVDPKSPAIAYNRGLALHRLTRYNEAYRAIVGAINEASDVQLAGRMEFAAGNTAVMLETWTDARDRYVAVLHLDPTDAAAKANLELVLSRTNTGQRPSQGNDGDTPQNGDSDQQPPLDGQSSDAPQQQPGPTGGQPGGPQQGEGADSQPGQSPQPGGDADTDGAPAAPTTFAEAQAALEAALGALGPEVSREQALRILELARQANSLDRLPRSTPQDGGPPPPR
ncbi:MAG: VWA domain-containing protein [Dehalococcoidia bacterium]|nr:MAG: VWA domain-containing protein [Dehalococcoidia bacterium]